MKRLIIKVVENGYVVAEDRNQCDNPRVWVAPTPQDVAEVLYEIDDED